MKYAHLRLLLTVTCLSGFVLFPLTHADDLLGITGSITPQEEIQAGVQMDRQIQEQYKISPNKALQLYVERIGHKIAYQTHLDYPFNYTVLEDPRSANAFSGPGGFIYITTGLINILETESQLAAVLAHETGHVMKRHVVKHMQQKDMTSLAVTTLSALTGKNLATPWTQAGEYLLFQKFSREDEFEADAVGTNLLVKAGYDPRGMVQLLRKLSAMEGQGVVLTFMQSHPASAERAEVIDEYIRRNQLQKPGQVLDTHEFHMVVR